MAEDGDLEKGDHAVQTPDPNESQIQSEEAAPNSTDESLSGEAKDEPLTQLDTTFSEIDEDDPFALFPSLAITMSSTRGPGISRRNTTTTLGRPLTRQETIHTLKTIRSKVTEAREEFDENVRIRSEMRLITGRYS